MVVYWDLVLAFNVLVDYLLLFAASRLAGRAVARVRLLLGALLGGVYAALQLLFPRSVPALLLALALMGAAAFYGSGRALKLTLLFFLSSCGLAGAVLLLGQCTGGLARLARGVLSADLPWGVFFLAGGLSYLLLGVIFHDGAAYTGGAAAWAELQYRGRTARVRLLRDTGNTLRDPVTGLGVPVIDRHALALLIGEEEAQMLPRIACRTIGSAEEHLPLLCCEAFSLDGKPLGARSVALAERSPGGACAGLWCAGEKEENDAQTLLS